MFYVDINNGKITSKNYISDSALILNDNQKKITADIYKCLTNLPATFETDDEGNIISVTPEPIPETPPPEPTTEEMLLQAYMEIANLKARLLDWRFLKVTKFEYYLEYLKWLNGLREDKPEPLKK